MRKIILDAMDMIIIGTFIVGITGSFAWANVFHYNNQLNMGTAIMVFIVGTGLTVALCAVLALLAEIREAVRRPSGGNS